ncbi:zinc fingers and homeoboxes protein 3 [Bufo bufo]|uniref:zinc fingers and homeoboxes protein 3 n=1 Tax=Bufo bufo TaxID=8384 RepID=UPI001ABE8FA5|nr:zinc fingers and homeoboxes protein 3 [Bufo bufo]
MASKRKSTTPCMIPIKTLAVEGNTDISEEISKDEPQEILPDADLMDGETDILANGHENVDGMSYFCKYCNYGSNETSPFVEHMNTKHLDFREDPSYVCIACSFLVKDPEELESHNSDSHLGNSDLSWTVAKHENYTVVEQSIGPTNTTQDVVVERHADDYSELSITKTPIMKIMKNKQEKRLLNHVGDEFEKKSRTTLRNGSVSTSGVNNLVNSTILNGSIIGTVPVLQPGVTQLVSLNSPQTVIQPKLSTTIITPVLPKQSSVQKSQQLPTAKSLPKVMIPLSSIPTYNSSMDSNCFLKNSFNKFPYPTKAELCYLTVVTKYPEEQIKIWFTAQRLKQGISWSPEEIEDSRKKMFNTVIQSIPQPVPQPTITVLNAPLVANATNVHQLIQAALPGQIVSQPQGAGGLLVTQPILTNGIQGTTSVPITTSSVASDEASTGSLSGLDFDYHTISPGMPSPNAYDPSSRCKKSRQQLGALKGSFCKSQFPSHSEVARLTRITGLATRDVRKWFSDKRYHFRNKPASYGIGASDHDPTSDMMYAMLKDADTDFALPASHTPSHTPRRQSWHQSPDFTVTRYKERAPEQLRALESSFAQNNEPSDEEVNRLRTETKMTRREIDTWFSEKRKKVAEELKRKQARYEEEEDVSAEEMEVSDKVFDDSVSSLVDSSVSERKVNPIKINLKALRVTESGDNLESSKDYTVPSNGSSRPSTPQRYRPSTKKTAKQRDSLKQMFVRTQWPSTDEYDILVEHTGLTRSEIVRWFGDARYSYKNGNLKWYDNYKKVFANNKPMYVKPLLDYYRKWHALNEEHLEDLCEKTSMTAEEIRSWIALKLEEDMQPPLEEAGEEPQSVCEETPEVQIKMQEGWLEPSENSESWEPASQEMPADLVSSQPSVVQLEAD